MSPNARARRCRDYIHIELQMQWFKSSARIPMFKAKDSGKPGTERSEQNVRFSIIPFLLLGIPLAEIAVFVIVGQQIGLFPTLGLVIGTAVLGSILLRVQGFGVLSRMQRELAERRLPGRELVHGVMILLAGLLTAAASLFVGPLSFIGLIAPHLARLLGLARPAAQGVGAVLAGIALMVVSDWLARMAAFPYQLPLGLFASLLAGPYLVWLLGRAAPRPG